VNEGQTGQRTAQQLNSKRAEYQEKWEEEEEEEGVKSGKNEW
jgi:hypothetical protein